MIDAYSIYYIPNGPSRRNRREHFVGFQANLDNLNELKSNIESTIGPVKMKTYHIQMPFGYRAAEGTDANL